VYNVEVEPHLQPLDDETFQKKTTNVQDGARLDITMNGLGVAVMKDAIQTSECLTLLLLTTVGLPSIHATGNTNLLRSRLMSQESGKWGTAFSLL